MPLPKMNEFKLEENLMIIDVKTASFLLSQDNGSDVLALYIFYYKTAKLQKTNQIRATELFCRTGLKWGVKRFRTAQSVLTNLNLINILKSGDKWYIRVGYIRNNSAKSSLVENEPNSAKKQLDASGTQMLNTNRNINAYTLPYGNGGSAKKQPSCPLLNGSPFSGKYPNGHTECVDYLVSVEERRDFKFINRSKQFKCIHSILRSNFDFEAMNKTVSVMEKKYGKGNWDFATMVNFLEKGSSNEDR